LSWSSGKQGGEGLTDRVRGYHANLEGEGDAATRGKLNPTKRAKKRVIEGGDSVGGSEGHSFIIFKGGSSSLRENNVRNKWRKRKTYNFFRSWKEENRRPYVLTIKERM